MPASSDSEKDLQHQRLLRVAVPPTPSDSFSVVCTAVTDPNPVWPGLCSVSPPIPTWSPEGVTGGRLDPLFNEVWLDPPPVPLLEDLVAALSCLGHVVAAREIRRLVRIWAAAR